MRTEWAWRRARREPSRVALIVASTLAAIGASALATPPDQARAVSYPGGTTDSGTAPWVAAIFFGESGTDPDDFQILCTGTLIDERHVLTAAHCVVGRHPSDLSVRLGGRDLADSSPYQVTDSLTHPRYTLAVTGDNVGLPHDIALIRLNEPVTAIESARVAPNDDTALRTRAVMTLYGWGENHNGELTDRLAYTRQLDQSRQAHRWFPDFNPRTQIAAGLLRRRENVHSGACRGDSGGPLVGLDTRGRPYVLGVVSYGAVSCRAKIPTVYTRVSAYRTWIERAREQLRGRVETTPIEYLIRDRRDDSEGGEAGRAVELSAVYVASTPTTLTIQRYLRNLDQATTTVNQVPSAAIVDDAGTALAYVLDTGVNRPDGTTVCPSVTTRGRDRGGTHATLTVDSACLHAALGRTSFDLDVYSFAYPDQTRAGAPIGVDSVRVDYVSLHLP